MSQRAANVEAAEPSRVPGRNHYLGRAGQMAVMSEFLLRGYNVAVPEVDIGDDLFVVRDSDGALSRIQVKATNAIRGFRSDQATFTIAFKQVITPIAPPLYFIFAVRSGATWTDFLVINRADLDAIRAEVGFTPKIRTFTLTFTLEGDDVRWKGRSFQAYRNNWDAWPRVLG